MPEGRIEYIRRKYPRVDLELTAAFRVIGTERGELHILTKTLGGGGLMFISPVQLSVGDILEAVLFYLTLQIQFKTKVVWTEQQLENQISDFKCGLEYTEISDEDRSLIFNIVMSNQDPEP